MKVSSLVGAATASRNAMLQTLTLTGSGPTTTQGVGPSVQRPVAMAPPPRSSSFGGADPRALFEALVQSFDLDGDGKLSLDEVNALNHGGVLSRNFARIDTNADGAISGDEIAALVAWGGELQPAGDRSGPGNPAVRPLFDKLTDHLNSSRDAAISAENLAITRQTEDDQGFKRGADGQMRPGFTAEGTIGQAAPATLMESMVLALTTRSAVENITTGNLPSLNAANLT